MTLAELRERILTELGLWESVKLSASGGSSGESISNNLFMEYPENSLDGCWIYVVDGTYKTEARQIESNQQSTGQVHFTRNFSGQIISGVTIELSWFNPTDVTKKLNNVIKDCYPYLANEVTDISTESDSTVIDYEIPDGMTEVYRVRVVYINADDIITEATEVKCERVQVDGVDYIRLNRYVPNDYWIEMRGIGYFDELEDDDDEITLPANWEQILTYGVCSKLLRTNMNPMSTRDNSKPTADEYEMKFMALSQKFSTKRAVKQKIGTNLFSYTQDGF